MPTLGAALLVLLGLWQKTQYSVLLRLSPCIARWVWHWLHLAMSTTWRRFTMGEPSTLKYITLLSAAYCVASCFTVLGRMVSARRASHSHRESSFGVGRKFARKAADALRGITQPSCAFCAPM